MDGDEVATGKDRKGLDEGIERMEGKSCEGSDCFSGVMDDVYFLIDAGVMKQSMTPISEELVITHMKQQVERSKGSEGPLVLNFGVVGVPHFDQRYEGSLPQYVEQRPLYVIPECFWLVASLKMLGSEGGLKPVILYQMGQGTDDEVEGDGYNESNQTRAEIFIEKRVLGSQRFKMS